MSDPKAGLPAAKPRFVLGTAGHIDHGKTELVRALTGTDTDRLPEEKARGITIELGFAVLDLEGGLRMSVVDVPGHERFVRTMVSGASGVDLVLLVVAADEGVMPQTREHIAICELLGIDCGVVALTKIDCVDAEMRALASADIADALAGTKLEGAPVVPVSSRTGEGLGPLREALAAALEGAVPRTRRQGPARLGIDRVFGVRGFGTVVTGTLVGSALEVGQPVTIYPSGEKARIRGLQTHGHEATRIEPGVRCAVNLQGIETALLSRGESLAPVDALAPTDRLDVEITWLADPAKGDAAQAIEFLAGTAKRRARIAPIGDPLDSRRSFARIHIEGDPVPLLPGDRFIARGFAREAGIGGTLGGGVVLDVAPPHRRRSDPGLRTELETLRSGDVAAQLRVRIARTGFEGITRETLLRETGLDRPLLESTLDEIRSDGVIDSAGTRWIASDSLERLASDALGRLDAFHEAEPLRPGMQRSALIGGLPKNLASEFGGLVLERLRSLGQVAVLADLVRRSDFAPRFDQTALALLERIRSEARSAGLEPPSPRDWAPALGIELAHLSDLLAHLEREGTLVRAPGDLWFDGEAVLALQHRFDAGLREKGEIDTPTYKAIVGTSRRTLVPLMEYFDEKQLTRRRGNRRLPFKG